MKFGCAVLIILWAAAAVEAQPPAAPPLVLATAVPDRGSQTLTISGSAFGSRPFVTLNLVPLTVQFASNTHIVAAVPINMMPAGTYLLTVSRGASAGESASLDVNLGGALPSPELKLGPTASGSPIAGPAGSGVGPSFSSGAKPAPDLKVGPTSDSGFGTPADVAAKVGDQVITLADIDREWQRTDPASYVGVARRIHELRRRVADTLVADQLLAREAKARQLTVDALLAEEIPKRITAMPDSAVASLYQGLGDTTRGASLEQMRPALRAWLARFTEPEIAKMNYVEELMKVSTRADIFLTAPRVEIARRAGDASLGPAAAPIEIVAFGDLRNARYAAAARQFGPIRDTFGDRVRFVFRHLPSIEPESLAAAEAAECAHAQGKFWAFHDALLPLPGPVGPERLKETAGKAGLNREPFDACVDRGEFRGAVEEALEDARRYDIQASPSFVVNGRLAPEPPPFLPPFEFFTRIIEEELQGNR